MKVCYVMMKKDIAALPVFKNSLGIGQYYDLTGPYGYGGPLIEGEISEENLKDFFSELTSWANEEGIVSQMVRFHPLLQNQEMLRSYMQLLKLKQTVYIDTTFDKEKIMERISPSGRREVRRAAKKGVYIKTDKGENLKDFLHIYNETMQYKHAADYYYFDQSYFQKILQEKENIILFYALYDDITISSALFYYNDRYMHYHLSGTLNEYRNLCAANRILYEAACWAHEKNIQALHLGGGVGAGELAEDSLFDFKQKFNPSGRADYYVGSNIFSKDAYEKLMEIRKQDPNFNPENAYLIQYRG